MRQFKKALSLIILLITSTFSKAQTADFSINGGLSFCFGTHVNRVGVFFGGYFCYDFFQINSLHRIYYNFSTLGENISCFEYQGEIGGVLAYGNKTDKENHFHTSVSNQTMRKYSVAYAFNYYLDNRGTSQRGGTIALQFDKFFIASENDILGGEGDDKYRTGAVFLAYTHEKMQFGISSILWTGNTSNKNIKVVKDENYPARFGYKDISKAEYFNRSHGILAAQLNYKLPYGQIINSRIGADAEQIRNVIQNRMMHDMYFLPKKWIPHANPHVPMVSEDEKLYLFKKNQKIKPARFFFDAGLNNALFY